MCFIFTTKREGNKNLCFQNTPLPIQAFGHIWKYTSVNKLSAVEMYIVVIQNSYVLSGGKCCYFCQKQMCGNKAEVYVERAGNWL